MKGKNDSTTTCRMCKDDGQVESYAKARQIGFSLEEISPTGLLITLKRAERFLYEETGKVIQRPFNCSVLTTSIVLDQTNPLVVLDSSSMTSNVLEDTFVKAGFPFTPANKSDSRYASIDSRESHI